MSRAVKQKSYCVRRQQDKSDSPLCQFSDYADLDFFACLGDRVEEQDEMGEVGADEWANMAWYVRIF